MSPKAKQTSGYVLFCKEKRAMARQQNPRMSFGEIAKILGSMWTNLSGAEKAAYTQQAKQKKGFGSLKRN
jgi:high mobility group protein B2